MKSLAALLLLVAQAVSTPTPEGRGEIRGRVVDKDTGRPLANARVTLAQRQPFGSRSASTDDRGAFRFTGLAAGRYEAMIEPGARRGTHVHDQIREFTLAATEVREFLVALPRARTITVRVVDEFTDPLARVRVSVRNANTGQPAFSAYSRETDDLGRLRAFGLTPGPYILCAEPSPFSLSAAVQGPSRERLLRTCYPSVADESEAVRVQLKDADLEVEIRMRRGRTYTVTGRVIDAAGGPAAGAILSLRAATKNSSASTSIQVQADGTFVRTGTPPGEYALQAVVGGPDRPEQRRPLESAFVPVRIDSDLDGVVVSLSAGVDVEGRFVVEESASPFPDQRSGLQISTRLAGERVPGSGSSTFDAVRADRTFTLEGVHGPRFVHADAPAGWYVKAIRYGNEDVTDKPVDFSRRAGKASLEIILSDRGAEVSGRVLDDLGKPVRRVQVLVFREELARPGPTAMDITTAEGAFRLGPLRGGDYRVVALPTDVQVFNDWAKSAKYAALGERLSLNDQEQRTIDLTVRKE